jgi:hypothetical protein
MRRRASFVVFATASRLWTDTAQHAPGIVVVAVALRTPSARFVVDVTNASMGEQ